MPKNHTSSTFTSNTTFSPIKLKTTTVPPSEDYYILPDYEYEEDTYKKIFNVSTRINLVLQIATVLVNLPHLVVLLRKDLRSFAIYIFMIGICICDILNNSLSVIGPAGEIGWLPILFAGSGEMSCLRMDYSEVNVPAQAVATVMDISRRLSVWLSILMAAIRSLSVMFPMSQRVQNMSKPKGAVVTLGLCVMFWMVFNCWQFALYRVFWLPDNISPLCRGTLFQSSITPRYVIAAPEYLPQFMSDWGFIDAILKLSSAICYPFLTISLLITLRTIKKRRQNLQKKDSDSPDHTQKLILFMTISFMLSEGLAGIQEMLQYNNEFISEHFEDLGFAITASQYPISVLRTVNSLSHPFVCFLLSSQYRDAVKGIFVTKTKAKKPDFTKSTSNIRNRKATNSTTTTTSF